MDAGGHSTPDLMVKDKVRTCKVKEYRLAEGEVQDRFRFNINNELMSSQLRA